MNYIKLLIIALFVSFVSIFYGCSQSGSDSSKNQQAQADSTVVLEKPKVTFVELGSVNCIPCKMMQPVMKAIEKLLAEQGLKILKQVKVEK